MPTKPLSHSARLRKARPREHRRGSTQRGYTSVWQRARRRYLAEHPLCVECKAEGRVEAATVVDHVIPHKGDDRLFWDAAGNWAALCKPHHDRKTAKEDGGFGRAVAPRHALPDAPPGAGKVGYAHK